MFAARHHHPIGIDIHNRSICALQLRKSRKRTQVRSFARLSIELEGTDTAADIDSLGPSLNRLRRDYSFCGKWAVVSLPPEYLMSFPVTFELDRHQSLESALIEASRKHLSIPVDEAVIDYLYVQETEGDNNRLRRASMIAAPKRLIAQILHVFKRCGFRIGIIDFNLAALIRLHGLAHSLSQTPSILIHIGEESSLLAVVSLREVVAHRHLNWGIGRLKRRLAQNMNLAAEDPCTMNMLHEYGLAHGAMHESSFGSCETQQDTVDPNSNTSRVVSQIVAPYLEDLIHELYQLIGYTRSQSQEADFEEICLYGAANQIKDLAPYLKSRLQIPTRGIYPFERLGLLKDDGTLASNATSPYVYALGLAMRRAA